MSNQHINKQGVEAIILAGSRDFGRCQLASNLPTALWPVLDKPVLEHLLRNLSAQGIKDITVCSNGDASLLQKSIAEIDSIQLKFLDEPLPNGTAGCIREAASAGGDKLFLVFHAGIVSPPDIDMLILEHQTDKSDMTVVLEPSGRNDELESRISGIYICESSVLDYIPKEGFCDIKESLIPIMLQAGRTIKTKTLSKIVGSFRDIKSYLDAITNYLENNGESEVGFPQKTLSCSEDVWMAESAQVESDVRIYGPVVIMEKCCISKGVVIFGPTVIGNNTNIGKGSFLSNSVLWDDAKVGKNCEIQKCIIDSKAVVCNNTVIEDKGIPFRPEGILASLINGISKTTNDIESKFMAVLQPGLDRINKRLPDWVKSYRKNILFWLAAIVVLSSFIWCYWSELVKLWGIWQQSDEYSSGLLVPFITIYILWSRRKDIAKCKLRPSIWGLFVLLGAQAFRLFGLFFMYGSAESLSIVLSVGALVLLLLGWQILRKVFTTLAFLGLMLPLPNSVQNRLMLPLQSWATSSAVFCLEILGYRVVREGNIIHLNNITVAVAEACNGLRMIMAFFVIGGLVVLLVKRTWWEKIIVLLSILPIALLCNSIRLTLTAIAFTFLDGEQWGKIFHDFGGYMMMPLALGIIVLELWLLIKITTVPEEKHVVLANK